MSRNSGFVNAIKLFLDKTGLVSVWSKFHADYTHVHTDLKSVSTLDHFFVNERLLDSVSDASPLQIGDNLSRHSPIMMKLMVPKVSEKNQVPKIPTFR